VDTPFIPGPEMVFPKVTTAEGVLSKVAVVPGTGGGALGFPSSSFINAK